MHIWVYVGVYAGSIPKPWPLASPRWCMHKCNKNKQADTRQVSMHQQFTRCSYLRLGRHICWMAHLGWDSFVDTYLRRRIFPHVPKGSKSPKVVKPKHIFAWSFIVINIYIYMYTCFYIYTTNTNTHFTNMWTDSYRNMWRVLCKKLPSLTRSQPHARVLTRISLQIQRRIANWPIPYTTWLIFARQEQTVNDCSFVLLVI